RRPRRVARRCRIARHGRTPPGAGPGNAAVAAVAATRHGAAMKRRLDRFDRNRGFSLIEVVLAMILVALIMGIAVGGIRMSRKAAENGERRIEATNSTRVTQEFLRMQLARTLP